MIRHIVTWKLKAEDAEGKAASVVAIKAALEPLVDSIDEIGTLDIYENGAYPDTNWDVVLVAEYKTFADLDAYIVHPEHVKAASVVREHVSQRSAIDFEV